MDILKKQMPDAMERFVLGVTEDDRYIHRNIGDKNGEKLEKVDEETNEKIKTAISNYARRRPEAGEKVSDLNREFENEIGRILAELNDGTSNNNYLKVAEEAAKRYQELAINAKNEAEHEAAMEQVMDGFQAYNGEVRSNVRTEAHRDNIDKIVNKIESNAVVSRLIPAEIVAGAAGIALGLTQTGVRAIAGAGGGIIASSAISGLKERNRITEDRARMMRDIANGMDYGNNDKTAKYEKRIGGTLYDMRKAGDLTKNLQAALENDGENRSQDILRAIAEARVRIDFSDSEQKDLIAYSSADKRGKERLDLDIAVIRAEKSLSDEDKKTLEAMKAEIRKQVVDGYDDESGEHHAGVTEKDKDFKKFRTISAIKKSGKTLALGTAFFFGSQEIMAALDPAKIGVFEKSGLLDKIGIKTENNTDASETILASGFGRLRGEYMTQAESTYDIREGISNENEIKHYEEAGYHKVEVSPASQTTSKAVEAVDPSASTARVDVKYDGWANNGTKLSDGNELRAHIENGKFISTMRGASTMNGENIAYDPSTVKAYVTIGDAKFEVTGSLNEAGQMTWGENGVFTTPTGETIKAIGDNGEKLYKYFEIAADNGVDTDGVQHIIPLATDVGTNSFAGKIEQVVETVKEVPATYNFVRDIPGAGQTFVRDIDFNGIGFAPETARRGLGNATTRIESAPEPAENAPVAAPEAPETPPRTNGPTNLTYSRVEARTAPTPPETPPVAPEPAPVAPETPPAAPEPAPASAEPAPTPSETAPTPAPEVTVRLNASGGLQSIKLPPEYDNTTAATEAGNSTTLRNIPENLKAFAADYENAISARRDAIGDDLYYYLLTDEPFNSEMETKVFDAITNLTPEGKTAFKEVLAMRNNLPNNDKYQLNFGNALDLFLVENSDLLK